jgi:hypothetical protein
MVYIKVIIDKGRHYKRENGSYKREMESLRKSQNKMLGINWNRKKNAFKGISTTEETIKTLKKCGQALLKQKSKEKKE